MIDRRFPLGPKFIPHASNEDDLIQLSETIVCNPTPFTTKFVYWDSKRNVRWEDVVVRCNHEKPSCDCSYPLDRIDGPR